MSLRSFFRFIVLLALLLVGHFATRAQSALPATSFNKTTTGFGDPESMDPRYASASELQQLQEQVQNLTQAYSNLVEQYNEHLASLKAVQSTSQPKAIRVGKVAKSNTITRNSTWRAAPPAHVEAAEL
ncbi:hypothetical protein [Hymenobacter koreensis]|uniref:Uncharacterized protein n=1 Tax=Hymenobacter koreensis TaxID=1084523 RepID=A0ABP8IYE9_9BACT